MRVCRLQVKSGRAGSSPETAIRVSYNCLERFLSMNEPIVIVTALRMVLQARPRCLGGGATGAFTDVRLRLMCA